MTGKPGLGMVLLRRRFFPRTPPLVSYDWESDETGSRFCSSSPKLTSAGEPTMADPNNLSRNIPPFTTVPNPVEVLERLRDSYKGLSEWEILTGADRAVLAAVEITLKHVAKAS